MPSLVETILARAGDDPGRPLLTFEDERGRTEVFDRARLKDDAARYARALAAAGIGAGDPVLLLFPASHQTVGAFLGASCLGAVPAIHPPGGAAISAAAVRRLVKSGGYRAAAALPGTARELAEAGCPAVGIPDVASQPDPDPPFRIPGDADPAYVQLSSGTTGPARGVLVSHGAATRYPAAIADVHRVQESDVSVGWIPLFHDMGLVSHLLNPLMQGHPSFRISTRGWLRRPERLLQAIHAHRGTMTWMPNFAFRYCARRVRDEDLEGLDLSCWRIVGNGSEPVQIDVLEEFAERFAPAGFRREALVVGYGFAENLCGVTITPAGIGPRVEWVSLAGLEEERAEPVPAGAPGSRAVVSCGPPLPGVEIRIADRQDRPLTEREVGRILVRSDTLFLGYLGDPDATRARFAGEWFRSGDLGFLANGELFVAGRESDLVIVGGRNVHPELLESIAAEALAPANGRVAAFGIPDASGTTEVPVLVFESRSVTADEGTRAERAIREAILLHTGVGLGDVQLVPKGWIVKTTSGKIARAECRGRYLEERPVSEASAQRDVEREVVRLAERRLGVSPLQPEDDLGIAADSLQLASLLLEIEDAIGRRILWDAFVEKPTLSRLLETVRAAEMPSGPVHSGLSMPDPAPARDRGSRPPQGFRLRARLRGLAIRSLPYRPGMAATRWLGEHPYLRDILLERDVELLHRFYEIIERPLQDRDEFLRRAIALTLSRRFRDAKLAPRRTRAGSPWVASRPSDDLNRAITRGRGVILLHSHFGAHRVAARVTRIAGLRRMSVRKREIDSFPVYPGLRRAALARQLLAGQRTLEEGGIVDIAGDGLQGTSRGLELPFHGRRRVFRAGFAHLAEVSGAAVLPVFSRVEPNGRIVIEIGTPLEPRGENPGDRIHSMVRSYVGELEQKWRQDPANVAPRAMRGHLKCPS